jgi:chemotaxis protein methyltransferase CheR
MTPLSLSPLSEKCFHEFLGVIYKLTGMTVSKNRNSMVEGRLRKRITLLNLSSYESYLERVKEDSSEQVYFINLITTHETYFFRTPRVWDYIEKTVLPQWFHDNPQDTFLAWSAASSSGEEVYTLGILCESFREKNPSFSYQILGSDISMEMVRLSQKGEYSGRSIENFKKVKPNLFHRYMKPLDSDTFEVLPSIKSRVQFRQHNLFHRDSRKDLFSLILLRNVLIYFKSEDQERVMSLLAPKLSSKGIMIIGESESLSHIQTPFQALEPLVYTHCLKNNKKVS